MLLGTVFTETVTYIMQTQTTFVIQKISKELIQFFDEVKEDLGLSEEHLNILNCFLNPTMMIKTVEAPNPLNSNAESLENITREEKQKSKKASSNEVKCDPIWEFFNPDNPNFDPSEIDLRNALANVIAVVFGLPNRSTHLWYHMLTPGDLESSYLTGCMVCL